MSKKIYLDTLKVTLIIVVTTLISSLSSIGNGSTLKDFSRTFELHTEGFMGFIHILTYPFFISTIGQELYLLFPFLSVFNYFLFFILYFLFYKYKNPKFAFNFAIAYLGVTIMLGLLYGVMFSQ